MDRIQALQIYARVVETGSFTRSADQLNLHVSAVSKAVKYLKNQLGSHLLNRTTRKIALTAEDEAFYKKSQRRLGEIEMVTCTADRHPTLSPYRRPAVKTLLLACFLACFTVPSLPAFALSPEEEARICDEYALPVDPQLPAGIKPRSSHPPAEFSRDLQACLAVLERDPDNPRLLLQTARVYRYQGILVLLHRNFCEAGEAFCRPDIGDDKSLRNLYDDYLHRAAERGYPAARYLRALSLMHKDGAAAKDLLEALRADAPALAELELGKWQARKTKSGVHDAAQAETHFQAAIATGSGIAREALAGYPTAATLERLLTDALDRKDAAQAAALQAQLDAADPNDPDYAALKLFVAGKRQEQAGNMDAALALFRWAAQAGNLDAYITYASRRVAIGEADEILGSTDGQGAAKKD